MKSISLCQVPSLYDTQSSSKWFSASRLDGFFISSFTSFTWIQLLKTWTFGELIWRTTKQGPHRCDILTGNRCHICPSVVIPSPPLLSPMSPPTPEGNVWSSDDTWHVPPLPLLSLQTTHTLKSQASSLVATWLPEPSPTPLRPWLMHDVLIRASLGNFQLMSGLHEYSRQIWFSIPATSLLLTAHRRPGAPLLWEMGWRKKNSRDKQNSHE